MIEEVHYGALDYDGYNSDGDLNIDIISDSLNRFLNGNKFIKFLSQI